MSKSVARRSITSVVHFPKTNTSRRCSSVLVGSIFLIFTLAGFADTSVWQVKSGDSTVFLGGTVHLLRAEDYPLPEEFEEAYQASTEIYFETDIRSMNDMSVQAQMLQQLTYADNRTLKTVLSDEAYAALEEQTAKLGLPLVMLEKFKPGMIVSTLQVMDFQRMGFTPEGVDAHFNSRAITDGKTIGQFETIQEQIGFLAKMGEGNESDFILLSLKDFDDSEATMTKMLGAWRSGNATQLAELFVQDMRDEAPELYESLLLQRNNNWLPVIEEMFQDNDTEFVLVGAAHLVGDEGLLAMLANKGYQVIQQ